MGTTRATPDLQKDFYEQAIAGTLPGGGGGGGEVNTASNVGAGSGLFKQKVAQDLEFKSLVTGTGIQLVADADSITVNTDLPTTIVNVSTASDLPTPVGGVITLVDDTLYKIYGTVVTNDRIVIGVNTPLVGEVNVYSQLVYTGTDTFITSASERVYIKNLGIITTAGASSFINKTGANFCNLRGYFLQLAGDFGSVSCTSNDFIMSQGFGTFSGTGVTVGACNYFQVGDSRLHTLTGNPLVDITGSSIDSMVLSDTQFLPLGNGPSISADAGSINIGITAGIKNCNFLLAFGQTWLSGGLSIGDLRYSFKGNSGIGVEESRYQGSVYLSGNTATTALVAGTPTAIAGTPAYGANDQRTNISGGLVTNISGEITQPRATAGGTVDNTGGGQETYTFEFYLSGSPVPNVTSTVTVDGNDSNAWRIESDVDMNLSDTLEVRVTSAGGNDCIVPDMQFIVRGQ